MCKKVHAQETRFKASQGPDQMVSHFSVQRASLSRVEGRRHTVADEGWEW